MTPIFRVGSWPSKESVRPTPIPRREGSARSAAALVKMTRLPLEPCGALSDGLSRRDRTPENGMRLGWP